jgi:hypothetical protein
MRDHLRVVGAPLGLSLAILGLFLVQACSSDAPAGGVGGAGSPAAGSGTAGAAQAGAPGAGASAGGATPTAGASGAAPTAGASGAGESGGAAPTAGAAGAAGAAPTAGAAGQTACETPPTGAERKAPAFPATQIPNPTGVLFRFMNRCPMTIWVQASNANNQFPGSNGVVELASKTSAEFDMKNGVSGRISAYKNAPPNTAGNVMIQFTEMNATKNAALNYNLSNVDWVGLPVEVKGIGGDPTCGVTGCYQPYANILSGCPAQLLDTKEGKCHAPNWYCGAHASEDFCKALNASASNTLANDPDCAGGTLGSPNDIFGCGSGTFWGQNAQCCAKVNRNYQGNAKSQSAKNNCSFYAAAPYNVYAGWSHKQCPFIYAFAYDDVAEQSGFHTCSKGTEMDITYCPGDP